MIGPDEAQRVLYASDHASYTIDGTETIRESNEDDGIEVSAMLLEDQTSSTNEGEDKEKSLEVMSAAPKLQQHNRVDRKGSSTSIKRAEDILTSMSGHRTDFGNLMIPNNEMRWNSTKGLNEIAEFTPKSMASRFTGKAQKK